VALVNAVLRLVVTPFWRKTGVPSLDRFVGLDFSCSTVMFNGGVVSVESSDFSERRLTSGDQSRNSLARRFALSVERLLEQLLVRESSGDVVSP